MRMKDMTSAQEKRLKELLGDRSIDLGDETFVGGGCWEGGAEHIPFSEIVQAVDYLRSIGVQIK